MLNSVSNPLRKVVSLVFTLSCVLLTTVLMVCCIHIYQQGLLANAAVIFTKEKLAACWPIITWVWGLWFVFLLLALILRPVQKPPKMMVPERNRLELLLQRHQKTPEMQRLEKQRLYASLGVIFYSAICGIYLYAIFAKMYLHPSRDLENVIFSLMKRILLCLPLWLAILLLYEEYGYQSILQECVLAQKAPLVAKEAKATVSGEKTAWIRFVMILLSLLLILLGILNGGMKDVLSKAIKICSECIGLG